MSPKRLCQNFRDDGSAIISVSAMRSLCWIVEMRLSFFVDTSCDAIAKMLYAGDAIRAED
jgi:hypothetical protein